MWSTRHFMDCSLPISPVSLAHLSAGYFHSGYFRLLTAPGHSVNMLLCTYCSFHPNCPCLNSSPRLLIVLILAQNHLFTEAFPDLQGQILLYTLISPSISFSVHLPQCNFALVGQLIYVCLPHRLLAS